MTGRVCALNGCTGSLDGKRRDALYCGARCRYAARNGSRGPRSATEKARARELSRERRQRDPEAARQRDKAKRDRLRDEILNAYGHRCVCCGETRREFLTLDHVEGGGRRERLLRSPNLIYARVRAEGFPDTFRILCWNCNCATGMYGSCPHERRLEVVA